jgi:acetate kinase
MLKGALPDTAPAPDWQVHLDVKWESGSADSWKRSLAEKIAELWTGKNPLLSGPEDIDIVGHRVVHGGAKYLNSVLIDEMVKNDIETFAKLAPLHNEINLDGILAAESIFPETTKQVAVFDTAFHRTLPLSASLYPLPYEWFEKYGIHKFGFHGINYQYCSHRAAQLLGGDLSNLNLIICHLGSGCSLAAVRAGKSVDTTMGFTPLDGLMMSTRSGGVDPGILLYVLRNKIASAEDLDSLLNHSSGLKGIFEATSDLKVIIEQMKQGCQRARLAFDMYTFRIRRSICEMRASLDNLDALIFTAGVGEHSSDLREAVCKELSFLGVDLDPALNQNPTLDCNIASQDSVAKVLVIEAREDWQIACDCYGLMKRPPAIVSDRS